MENITWEQIEELIPERVTLHYVDRDSSLEYCLPAIQKSLNAGSMDALYEKVDYYLWDDNYGFDSVKDELITDMQTAFDIEDYEAKALYEKFEDDIRDTIYDRDDSTVLQDLARNTSKFPIFYDTGHYVECCYPLTEKGAKEELRKIKKILGIKQAFKDFDKCITEMMYNASYGGNLVIYFTDNGYDLLREIEGTDKPNMIEFGGNVHIAIPNHSCGAGGDTEISHTFRLPFSHENLFVCKEVKYSYTYDVCGMYSNWCEGTNYKLIKTKSKKEATKSKKADYVKREAELDALFKSGQCVYGDTRYGRHQQLVYVNEYPCGHRCMKCGQFFID